MFKKFLSFSFLVIIIGIILAAVEGLLFGVCFLYVWNNFIVNFSESIPTMPDLVAFLITFLVSFVFSRPKINTNTNN